VASFLASVKRTVKHSPLGPLALRLLGRTEKPRTVFVGMASIPSREHSLRQVVESLLPQVTELGVFLNNWDAVPEFLKHPKIRVARSQEHGDVRDNGKFFWVEKANTRFYATVDDDIYYPADYIARLIEHQQHLGGSYAVGVHATTYPKPLTRLLRNRHLRHFSHRSDAFIPVDLIGTGTLLFERAYWQLKYSELGQPGMADVWFGVAASKRGFGLWTVPRAEEWMHALEQEDSTANLFAEGRQDDSVQLQALNAERIGSSRRSLLERVVRAPWAAANLAIFDAIGIHEAANKIALDELSDDEFRLFNSALVIHKREQICELPPALDELLDDYVEYLLHLASGRFFATDADFEADYKAVLKKIGYAKLPGFAARDWQHFGFRTPKTKVAAE